MSTLVTIGEGDALGKVLDVKTKAPFTIPGYDNPQSEDGKWESVLQFINTDTTMALISNSVTIDDLIVLGTLCKLNEYSYFAEMLASDKSENVATLSNDGVNEIVADEFFNLRGYFRRSIATGFRKPYVRSKQSHVLLSVVHRRPNVGVRNNIQNRPKPTAGGPAKRPGSGYLRSRSRT